MVGLGMDRRDLWKGKARCLHVCLKHRFRVVVDGKRKFSRGYFSPTMERWINRFRDFRRDPLRSSVFYRKRVKRSADLEDSIFIRALQAVAVPVLGNVCHVFMHGLNCVHVYGVEKLHDALLNRSSGKPLITVSNHVASMDDPLVIASLLPPRSLFGAHNLRWTLCATDRCFINPIVSAFFRCAKVLPVSRGDGVYQKGMDMAVARLNGGGWVHIFPEGTRSHDGGETMGFSRRGVGRLVVDADTVPLVIPFVHVGMQEVMPMGAKVPRIGKTLTVLVGDPIDFGDLMGGGLAANEEDSPGRLYDAIAWRIGRKLKQLKVQVDILAGKHHHHQKQQLLSSRTIRMTDNDCGGEEPAQLSHYHHHHHHHHHSSDVEPSMLLGFAARGLLLHQKQHDLRGVSALKMWRNYFEAHLYMLGCRLHMTSSSSPLLH